MATSNYTNVTIKRDCSLRLSAADAAKAELPGKGEQVLELKVGSNKVHNSLLGHWYLKHHIAVEEPVKSSSPPQQPGADDAALIAKVGQLTKDGAKRKKGESDADFVSRIEAEAELAEKVKAATDAGVTRAPGESDADFVARADKETK